MISFVSCKRVEIAVKPQSFKVKIKTTSTKDLNVFAKADAESFKKINSSDGFYLIETPMMRGGYTKFLFLKFKKSDPKTYPVFRAILGKRLASELSIEGIESLPKEDGFYVLSI